MISKDVVLSARLIPIADNRYTCSVGTSHNSAIGAALSCTVPCKSPRNRGLFALVVRQRSMPSAEGVKGRATVRMVVPGTNSTGAGEANP